MSFFVSELFTSTFFFVKIHHVVCGSTLFNSFKLFINMHKPYFLVESMDIDFSFCFLPFWIRLLWTFLYMSMCWWHMHLFLVSMYVGEDLLGCQVYILLSTRAPVLPDSRQHLSLPVCLAIAVGLWWYLIVALIYVFLMTDDVNHLLIRSLTIWISCFVKYLLPIFLLDYLFVFLIDL